MRPSLPPLFVYLTCQVVACTAANTDGGADPSASPQPLSTSSASPLDTAVGSPVTSLQSSFTGSAPNPSVVTSTGMVAMSAASVNATAPGGVPSMGGTASLVSSVSAMTDSSAASSTEPLPSVAASSSASSSSQPTADTSAADGGVAPPCVVDHGDEIPSLKEYFADQFAIGAAIDTQYMKYAGLLTKHFSSVTAEDQMKFESLQPTEGNFTYGTADQMVDFAISNGMQVRGHALVWHRQTPAWVFSGSRDQVLARMKKHISEVMKHFKGKVKLWDVVNEAIMDDGSYRTNDEEEGQQSGWYGALGESYIAEAFKAAHEADPDVKLFYNDYYNYHPVRRQAIYNMLKGLLDAGVPVNGVGLQGHLNLKPGTDPEEQSYYQTVENMETAIEMYSSLGLDVQITEMDLSLYLRGVAYTEDTYYTPEKVTPEILAEQAARYGQFFEMYRRHADVISSVSFWGISDDNTWLSEFTSMRQDFPLLFDANLDPKPAFWSIVDFCK